MTRQVSDAFQDHYADDVAHCLVVEARVLANDQVTARGVVVAVRMPGAMTARESTFS